MKLHDRLQEADETGPSIAGRVWEYVGKVLSWKIALITVPVIVASSAIILKRETVDYRTTMILREVSVPEALAKRGFTSRIVGEGVAAAVTDRGEPVLKVKDFKRLTEQLSLPEFDIAGTGINTSTLTGLIDSVRRPRGNQVALSVQCERADCSDGPLYMTVLIENHETGIRRLAQFSSDNSTAASIGARLDQLYRSAVPIILEVADPFVLAAYHFSRFEKSKGKDLSERELAFSFASRVLYSNAAEAPYAHNLIAQIYRTDGRYELAEHHFREALAKEGSFGLASHNWGHLLDGQGKFDEALEKYDDAISRGVSDWLLPWSEMYAAIMMVRLASSPEEAAAAVKRFDKAISAAKKYSQANKRVAGHPALGQIYADRALALIKARRFDDAVVSLREAATAKPDRPLTYYDWGRQLKKQGRFAEARSALMHAARLYDRQDSPRTQAEVETLLAEIELRLGGPAKALAIAEPILRRDLDTRVKKPAAKLAASAAASAGEWCVLLRLIRKFGELIGTSETGFRSDQFPVQKLGNHPMTRHCR